MGAVRLLAGITSLWALTRSAGYIFEYFYRFDNSTVLGVLMAAFISSVVFTTPQIGLIGIRKKNPWLVSLAGVILTIFMIFTVHITVDNLDYARKAKDLTYLEDAEKVLAARDVVATGESTKKDKAVDHARDGADLDQLQEKMRNPKNTNGEYVYYRDQYAQTKSRYDAYPGEITALNARIEKAKDTPKYYSTEIKSDAQKAGERGGDLAFAIGLDLVGPIFLAFALFL